jgi:hypothetical protein
MPPGELLQQDMKVFAISSMKFVFSTLWNINYGNPDFEHGFDGLKRIRRIYGTTRIYGFVKNTKA